MGWGAVAAGAAKAAGPALQAWLTWKGIKEQRKEAEKTRAFNLQLFDVEGKAEREEAMETRAFTEQQNRKAMQFKAYEDFLDRITSLMNTRPQLAANLMKFQQART